MSRRSRAREVVLQVLFQEDLNPDHDLHAADEFVRGRLQRDPNLVEFASNCCTEHDAVARSSTPCSQSKRRNWSLARMAATDRNVLRLAAFELCFTETPDRIVIDEAVRLARRFGSQQSSSFVNGILDGMLPRNTERTDG